MTAGNLGYKPARPSLTQNAIFWPAAEIYLKSTHVHDYVEHSAVIGGIPMTLANDGGLEYRRTVSSGGPLWEDFSLWEDSPFELVASRLLWGTYGPNGDQPRRWVPLKECETEHLQAILKTQLHVYGGIIEKVIKHILKERGVKPAALELEVVKKRRVRDYSAEDFFNLLIEVSGGSQTNKAAKKHVKRKARK